MRASSANDHQYPPLREHNNTYSEAPLTSFDKPSSVVRKGYTEFFSWGNDEDGQLGHGHDGIDRKKIFNLPKSLSFEVIITQVSCGFAHTSFISSK